jgi:hypothetical protein
MIINSKRAALLGSFVFSLFAFAQPAAAQWNVTGVGVAEYDTEETLLLLAGVSAGPGGAGWSPLLGVQTYYLTYKLPAETRNVFSVRPYAGLRNNFPGGSVAFTAGYAFVSDDDSPGPLGTGVADSRDGVVVSGSLDHWGTGGPLGYQLLASYNFGGESLWTRGRVTTRVSQLANGGQFRVGGEVAYANSGDFSMTQPGLVAEWHNGTGFILGFGVGRKIIADGDDATFFRVETVLPLSRR